VQSVRQELLEHRHLVGETVRAEELVGEVAGRSAVIVDDMISAGGTIEAAARVLQAFGASGEVVVVATHGLLVASAHKRLGPLVDRLVVTDSLSPGDHPGLRIEVRSIAALLADAIDRLHGNRDMADLLSSS
jgi:ribose-phosphate pyrophosphokinase